MPLTLPRPLESITTHSRATGGTVSLVVGGMEVFGDRGGRNDCIECGTVSKNQVVRRFRGGVEVDKYSYIPINHVKEFKLLCE